MTEETPSITLLSIAKDIRTSLPANVQEKYSVRDIHRTLALLLVKSGDIVRTESGLEPTEIGIDHGIELPEGEDSALRFSDAGVRRAANVFFKAYPSFSPSTISPYVYEEFRQTGRVVPSFEFRGRIVHYADQEWKLDDEVLPRDKIPWAEKQFCTLFCGQNVGVSILADIAEQFRKEGPKRLAAFFYEEAISKAEKSRKKHLLPRLASLYRALHMPLRTIRLFEDLSEEDLAGVISGPLLTSVAQAYCDVNNHIAAKELADRALELGGGRQSAELSAVYRRIRIGNGTGR